MINEYKYEKGVGDDQFHLLHHEQNIEFNTNKNIIIILVVKMKSHSEI